MKTFYLKRISFSRKDLSLEDMVRLIFIDKTNLEFDKSLHDIIIHLRKYSNAIKSIGYDEKDDCNIRVFLKLNPKYLSPEDSDFFDSISY